MHLSTMFLRQLLIIRESFPEIVVHEEAHEDRSEADTDVEQEFVNASHLSHEPLTEGLEDFNGEVVYGF